MKQKFACQIIKLIQTINIVNGHKTPAKIYLFETELLALKMYSVKFFFKIRLGFFSDFAIWFESTTNKEVAENR